jgi:hypothetical protein
MLIHQYLSKLLPSAQLDEQKNRVKGLFKVNLTIIPKKELSAEASKVLTKLIGQGTGPSLSEARTSARQALTKALIKYQGRLEEVIPTITLPSATPALISNEYSDLDSSKAGVFLKTFCDVWHFRLTFLKKCEIVVPSKWV